MKKLYRIRKNEEFSSIIGNRKSFANGSFVVYFHKKKEENSRAGISVSKKLGDAVDRNRIKRQVREMVRAIVDFDNCPLDFVIIVRKGYLNNEFLDNKNDLENLIKKAIIKQYEKGEIHE